MHVKIYFYERGLIVLKEVKAEIDIIISIPDLKQEKP